jgi:HEAT repeat protein
MLNGLNDVPWADLEHAYGPAADVPDLLRKLLAPDPKTRAAALHTLYGNVFHQGTRYPATPYVVPFLIEMCADPTVPSRGELLNCWGHLITGYFSVRARPQWGDGERIHYYDEIEDADKGDPYVKALHDIYHESLKGLSLLGDLLADKDAGARSGAAWVLACLPTAADDSTPQLEARLCVEASGWVRATIAFALGELGAPVPLRRMVAGDPFAAARCMAACELARIQPTEDLIELLLRFVSEPIEEYENIPGAGGKSTGDAAFSITKLPAEIQLKAVPAICDRLEKARSFDTIPLVHALLSAAFPVRKEPLTELTDFQKSVLSRMVNTEELWSISNLSRDFRSRGLSQDRSKCAQLAGVHVEKDEALAALRSGLIFAQMGFLEKGRDGILRAIALDPAVLDRSPAPDEAWLLTAKAFAEPDPQRAIEAFRHACSINPAMAGRVNPTWRLAELIKNTGLI